MNQGEGGGPPGSPRPEDDGGTIQDDDWLLAAVDHWILRGRTKEDIVQRVITSFDPNDLRDSGRKLRRLDLLPNDVTVPSDGPLETQDYHRRLADVVVCALTELQKMSPLKVRFWVCGADLRKVPGLLDFPDILDEPAVSARLGTVDSKLQQVLDRLSRTEQLEETVSNLAQTVTALKEQLRLHQVGSEQLVARQVREQTEQVVGGLARRVEGIQEHLQKVGSAQGQSHGTSHQPRQSYAGVTEGRSRLREVQDAALRERSRSSKRGREEALEEETQRQKQQRLGGRQERELLAPSDQSQDTGRRGRGQDQEYTLVQRRRSGGVKKGSSDVEAEGGERAPLSIFLSGTSPATTEDIVKEKLRLCAVQAKGDQTELIILKVEHIPLRKIPLGETPRSRCWKVTVAPDWAEHMLTCAAYPGAWGWRRWNRGPDLRREQGQQGDGTRDGGA